MSYYISKDPVSTINLFESIVASSTEYGIIATDKDNRIIVWNSGAEKIYGYSASEMLGNPIPPNLNSKSGVDSDFLFLAENAFKSNTIDYKMNAAAKNGQIKPVSITITSRTEENEFSGLLIIVRDITKHIYEEQFRALLLEITQIVNSHRTIDDMCLSICNTLNTVLQIPTAFICLFDYQNNNFYINSQIGLTCNSCSQYCIYYQSETEVPENIKSCYDTYSQFMITSEELQNHYIQKCVDPQFIKTDNNYIIHIPLTSDDILIGILHIIVSASKREFLIKETQILSLIANEITAGIQRKRLIEEIRDNADNLERMVKVRTNQLREKDALLVQSGKLATLGEMATGVAHEINQPLGGISLMTQGLILALKRNKLTEDMLSEKLYSIVDQVERINKIIDHLRTFARQSDDQKKEVDAKLPLLDVFKLIGEQLSKKDITVELDLADNLPIILADHNKLEQIFLNIIGNARDALVELDSKKAEGEVSDKIRSRDKKISIKMYSDEKYEIIEISDNGIGIPESIINKIFNPFFTTKEIGKGTGLGLSITYGIVKEFDGTIEVESKEMQGTKFTIKFPIYRHK
jgi:two-component system NtrC family sensor kinase